MRTSILFISLIGVVAGATAASNGPSRMQRKIARRGDCVTCHRTIIPTETNTAMELQKATFHNGTLLCQYQSAVKSGGDGDERNGDDNGDGADNLEPDSDDEDEDEEDNEGDEEDAGEDEEDKEDLEEDDEADKEEEDEEDRDDADEDADENVDEEDEDQEDEDEKDEEECDPNDKYERRALGTHFDGAQDLRGLDDDVEQSDGYTVEYDCVYDVASGNLLEDQARSCPPVVSSSC
ncbi:hypothetical protein GGF50DRAFT_110099 [Schizophyllum commune]